ncbi:YceD family protein [Bacillus sp. 31A1R]|uniref:YceD family protein n=1 Tax=Robertmurraya mangrovi TaxID=3098077 RepID=A0ABU5IU58_9BACI|nr:YceD family protein [Bacillus sp. 31A1R]MDZ5470681.1 YceD family protein [Bacillus sp. 31A1R]
MKWTLSQLQKYRSKDFPVDEMVNVDEIKQTDQTIREVSPMHVTGRADIDSTKVTFHLKIKGHLVLPCSRTLVDVNYPINVETTETFLLKGSDYETEEEVHQVKGDVIDLMPVLTEILLLEVPMQVFCDDNSEGGAPQSGKDWEVIHELEKQDKIDPRLAGLAKLLDQNDTSSDS